MVIHKDSPIDAVCLRCPFMIGSKLKKGVDVVEAHTDSKTPGFEMHAEVERRLNWSTFKA